MQQAPLAHPLAQMEKLGICQRRACVGLGVVVPHPGDLDIKGKAQQPFAARFQRAVSIKKRSPILPSAIGPTIAPHGRVQAIDLAQDQKIGDVVDGQAATRRHRIECDDPFAIDEKIAHVEVGMKKRMAMKAQATAKAPQVE